MGVQSIDAEDDQFGISLRYTVTDREKRLPMNGARQYPMKNTEN